MTKKKTEAKPHPFKARDPETAYLRAADNGVKFKRASGDAVASSMTLRMDRQPEVVANSIAADEAVDEARRHAPRDDVLTVIEASDKPISNLDLGPDRIAEAEAAAKDAQRVRVALAGAVKETRAAWVEAMRDEVENLKRGYGRFVSFTIDPDSTTINERLRLESVSDAMAPDLLSLYLVAVGHQASTEEVKRLREDWAARPATMPTLEAVRESLTSDEFNTPRAKALREQAIAEEARTRHRQEEVATAARWRSEQLSGRPFEPLNREVPDDEASK